MFPVQAELALSPGTPPPELHACWWQPGSLIHNQRPCLISLQLLREFLLSKSIIRADRMMKFNEHPLCLILLLCHCSKSSFLFPTGQIVSLDCRTCFFKPILYFMFPCSLMSVFRQLLVPFALVIWVMFAHGCVCFSLQPAQTREQWRLEWRRRWQACKWIAWNCPTEIWS